MTQTQQQASLEDVMVAMDVVDTLRHQQGLVDRELDTQGRRERLLERLKELYSAQGLSVPEHVLLEGIEALEQERFKYVPVDRSWKTKLAHVWVSRSRWGKPLGFFTLLALLLWAVYFFVVIWPEKQLRSNLPSQLSQTLAAITKTSKTSEPVAMAESVMARAQLALNEQDFDKASVALTELQTLDERLSKQYTLRVLSKQNRRSGVWRIPDANSDARNFYLIVEAVDSANRPVEVTIVSEENNQTYQQSVWGLRVDEETFFQVASDKQDDGIIQNNVIGVKESGYLTPTYNVSTSGAAIAEW